jgi:outer membrane protein TolC
MLVVSVLAGCKQPASDLVLSAADLRLPNPIPAVADPSAPPAIAATSLESNSQDVSRNQPRSSDAQLGDAQTRDARHVVQRPVQTPANPRTSPPNAVLDHEDEESSAQTKLVAWQPSDARSSAADQPLFTPLDALRAPTSSPTEETLPAPLPPVDLENGGSEIARLEAIPTPSLSLDEVLASVVNHYPLLRVALAEQQIAAGKEIASLGEFDTSLKGYSLAMPLGFYENYRSLVGLTQPMTDNGGFVFGGYKIADGFFQPWYGERETNEGGELSLGMQYSLWQNRGIDKRRAAFFQARLDRLATNPFVQAQWLEFSRTAAQTYWGWVAAGKAFQAQQRLLDLATMRVDQIAERIRVGDLERIADIDNRRLIASREAKLIETQRKFQESAIKLSLFLRSENGEPLLADLGRVPSDFPEVNPPTEQQLDADINQALTARPEIAELNFQIRRVQVELNQAQNMLQPKLDATVSAAQDVGGQTSSKGDKTPFELEAGLLAEVPLQRREAQGKIRSARGKLAQLAAKREFVANKTVAAVQDAYSALLAAAERIERTEINEQLARQSLEIGRQQYDAGDIDLIVLNIREEFVNDAELLIIQAEADFFSALAAYEALLARDPLQL